MWRDFDAGAIADDFAHIAALGLDGIRFFVRWDEFQPEPDRIDATMLDRLERFTNLASDVKLRIIPTLFCGHTAGANYLPSWILDRNASSSRFPTFTGETRSNLGAANMYAETFREPQLLLARTVGERLREHPAIRAWDIGNAFSRVREPVHAKLSTGEHSSEPAGEREMAAWSAALTRTLRQSSALPTTATASFDDLAADRDVRLGMLCAPFAFASIGGLNVDNPFARNRLDFEATPFFAMLAAAFSFQPIVVSAFGMPVYSASEEEAATFATEVLDRLHEDGRLGAYWHTWADHADPMLALDAASGLVRGDGTEKPAAAALRAFARERRTVVEADDMPMIAAAYYYRTLPKSAHTLYEAYLRFVDKRRHPAEAT